MRVDPWNPSQVALTPSQAGGFGGAMYGALQAGPQFYQKMVQNKYLAPLLQQKLAQQQAQSTIQGAQAKYAPEQQLGIAQQQMGAGATSLAQGRYAPQYFGGQAAQSVGSGMQNMATGIQSPEQQAAITNQLQQSAINQQLINKYVPASQQAQIGATALSAITPILHNMVLAGASRQAIQEFINQSVSAAHQINPAAPNITINPADWLNNSLQQNPPVPGAKRLSSGAWVIQDRSSPQGYRMVG